MIGFLIQILSRIAIFFFSACQPCTELDQPRCARASPEHPQRSADNVELLAAVTRIFAYER